jgi:hypothetical protein
MMDILFALGQILCAFAFVCGAYLVMTQVGIGLAPGSEDDDSPDGADNWKRRYFDS